MKKSLFKKVTTWIVTVAMILTTFGSSGMMAFATETETSPTYNHGTIAVTADADTDMTIGDTLGITVHPYVHMQYKGCQMNGCPEKCGGEDCFEEGLGCKCEGTSPVMRTATVNVTSSDPSVVAVGSCTAKTQVGSAVGDMADGQVNVTAVGAGEATVTVSASLCDWLSTTKTFTVTVKTDAAVLSGITVTTAPTKTEYTAGESFDPAGMVVTANYSDNTSKVVDAYTYAPTDALTTDDTKVTISYTEGDSTQTAEVAITVNAAQSDEPELIDGYYQIDSAEDLIWFSEKVNTDNANYGAANIKITENIVLKDEFVPIGLASATKFSGTIDGNGHSITLAGFPASTTLTGSTLNISYAALVGYSYNATIKNLTLEGDIAVSKASSYVGAFVSYVAANTTTTIENCINRVNITDNIKATAVGGFVPYTAMNATLYVTDCVNYGNITSDQTSAVLGGILGTRMGGNVYITRCGNEGKITSQGTGYAAGIIGKTLSSSTAQLSLSQCYNAGAISSVTYAGGLTTSFSYGTMTDCYNVGTVASTAPTSTSIYVGGLSGELKQGTITNSYNAGAVTMGGTVAAKAGALVGYISNANGVVTNSYYLESTYSVPYSASIGTADIKSVTESELKGLASSLGENFQTSASNVNNGYPVLIWQDAGESVVLSGITVTTAPTKTEYTAGESFDPAGMVVTANYSDNTSKVVDAYTYAPTDALTTDDTKVTVSYTEGDSTQTAEVAITVNAAQSDEPELIDGYYQIDSAEDLNWFSEMVRTDNANFRESNAKITKDIVLTEPFVPIGYAYATQFYGSIDGDGNTITFEEGFASTVEVNGKSTTLSNLGLVGYASSGVSIKNLTLEGTVTVQKSSCSIGAFMGYATSKTQTIENCINKVNINDTYMSSGVGGFVGKLASNTYLYLTDCINYGNITSTYVGTSNGYGGLLGKRDGGWVYITNCGNEGDITATGKFTGGLIGNFATATTDQKNAPNAVISKSYNAGHITGSTYVGGIVPLLQYGTVTDCYNVGTIESTSTSGSTYMGGIIGHVTYNATVDNAYNAGSIVYEGDTTTYVGAFGGRISNSAVVTNGHFLDGSYSAAYGTNSAQADIKNVSDSELKNLAETLGENWQTAASNVNNGYPVLIWQDAGVSDKAEDWVEIDDISGLKDISAKGFAIRHLDKNGNVLSAKYFTEDEMRELAEQYNKTPYYYTFGCGMLGYPSLAKGEGVQLTDLLELAGIEFGEGQKLMLRATDVLADEMGIPASWRTGMLENPTDEQRAAWEAVLADTSIATKNGTDAYYTNFTYDYLMGTPRYSFAKGMQEAMLANPEMTQTDLYNSQTVIQSGLDGGEVSPLLCFGFGQIYANQVTDENSVSNIAMSRADAYRFCFGQAMDGDSISSANTRFQTAYNVFGLDIVDTEDITLKAEGTYTAGESVKITADEPAVSSSSDFFSNVTGVTLVDQNGVETVLSDAQYSVGYERGTTGWVYYLTINEGVILKAGTYTAKVTATTFSEGSVSFEVGEAVAPSIVDFSVTSKEHDDADEELNQTIIVTITFDHGIALGEDPASDLEIKIGGGDVKNTARDISYEVNPENSKQLVITMTSTGWAAITSGLLNINEAAEGIRNITALDGTTPAKWTNLETYITTGIALENASTTGTADTAASTTVTVAHKANMRGMYHVQVLSNGTPVLDITSPYYAGTVTSHAHNFYTSVNEAYIAKAITDAFNSSAQTQGKAYTAVYNNDNTFTISADTATADEVITVQMFEYNEDGRTVDPLLRKAAAAAETALNNGRYTEDSVAVVETAIAAAEELIGTNPSLEAQAAAKAAISEAVANLVEDPAAEDWVEIDEIEGLKDISAKGFAIRHLDKNGNVLSEKYFTEDEMRALAEQYDKTPYYYTFGCGMLGYPSLAKGEGVQLTDLLELAGVEFGEGQKLMLRATDVLADEMGIPASWKTGMLENPTDEQRAAWDAVLADTSIATKNGTDAYYTYFTYDYLMGTPRYSFAKGMQDAMLADPDMTQSDLYSSETVIQSGLDGGVVSPLLCFGFGQIYANEVTDETSVSNIAMSRADAYRFCFGQALDENGNISSANTRFQTAYNVFGIDIVDTEAAPELAVEETPIEGQSAVVVATSGENAFTDGSDFTDNITEVSLTYPDGTVKVLADDQYKTGYRRMTDENGSYYYVGTVTLAEGVLDAAGEYTLSVKADTYEDTGLTFNVLDTQEAPALRSTSVTLRYTGDPLTIYVTNGSDNWAANVKSVAIVDADGNETVLDESQYEITASAIKLNRTAEDPIMSVSTEERTAEYTIKVTATGYKEMEQSFDAVMYGASTFQVRLVDGDGNVVSTKTFTMDEIKAMSSDEDAYYNTICSMTGIRSFKAQGVLVSELLEEADINFGEGMTLQLRTNDSTSEDGYYRLGTFTYEDLMQERYYFPDIFTDSDLHDTLINGSKFGEDVRTALAASTKVSVEPMIAFQYIERIYRTDDSALTDDEYDSLVAKENAFRFLFGIAMDAEDDSMISGTTTTWSASYGVFGIDIIDPNYSPAEEITVKNGLSNTKDPDGNWYYYTDNKVDYNYTGLAKNKNGWYYVENGKVNFSYTGFASNSLGDWYVERGQVKFNKYSVIKDTNGALEKGTWFYVVKSKVIYTDTVAQNENGWWVIQNGKVNFNYTGFASNKHGDWYAERGKVRFDKYSVIKDTNGALGSAAAGTWYYVVKSKVIYTDTVAKNANGWWVIQNGKVNFGFTGIAANSHGTWYIKGGKVNFDYTGKVRYQGVIYQVSNGRVVK